MIWSQGHQLQSGKYRIIRELGRGGFGLTYLAEDCILSRQVVIKTPNRQFQADQEYEKFIRRFQREGQVLAKISHPNVVQVIEFFQEAGIPCLVMAYVDGETLNERIHNQGRLSENEAVEHFRKLAVALQRVHQVDLIHCDIHPGNIMLRRQTQEPVLIDFGSAKSLQPATFTVTTTVNQNFTPYEQHNKSRKRQPTLDVYALAATLYFAITGEKPLAAMDRKLYGHTLKSPQEYQPGLSDWLNQAILKGMALEPENRPQSMQAWLGFLHPPQPKQRQAKLSPYILLGYILLGFVFLGYLAIGTFLELSNTEVGAWALLGTVTGTVTGAAAGAGVGAVTMTGAVTVAVGWALLGAMTGTVTGAGVRAMAVTVVVTVAGNGVATWAVFWIVKSLEKCYDYKPIVIILGITSTVGLVLGAGILGWWLKLQGVSLPF